MILIFAVILMYGLAQIDKRSGWIWALITLVVCILLSNILPSYYPSIPIGVVVVYLLMYVQKLRGK